jgi:glycosyltransferase involved in cell wall biosynthesis
VRIAVFHNLPPGGGAIRVLAEYVKRAPHHDFTIYTRREPAPALVSIDSRAEVRARPYPETHTPWTRMRLLAALPRLGRRLADEMDGDGYDAVFCFSSDLVQAPEVLPYLRTPSLYYAPEALRIAHEDVPRLTDGRSWRDPLVRLNLDPYERRRRGLDRRHIRAARHVVTHSRFTARSLREIYGVGSEVVELGVDAQTFTPSPAPREGFVLSVGALQALKGHQFVIEAIGAMAEPRPRLVIVGDRGEFAEHFRALAAAREVDLDLRLGIPFAELLDLYRRAGVLACGQIREPFGLITLEAMATETPVVAVREGGFLETVDHDRTGLLVARDPAQFASALRAVLDDGRMAARLGREGRRDVEERWTWERTAARYDALLERIAGEGRTL